MTRQGGFGAVLKIDVSGLTAVAYVKEFEFPEFEKLLADITSHDSPGGYREMISTGKRQLNEFTCQLVWDVSSTTHAAMTAAFDSDAAVNMSAEDPDSTEVIAFAAHINKLGRVAEQEEGYVCDVSITPTGQPTVGS